MYYYGYRYYNPEMGRWINRDPIGELATTLKLSEGKNGVESKYIKNQSRKPSYYFCENAPICFYDAIGLSSRAWTVKELCCAIGAVGPVDAAWGLQIGRDILNGPIHPYPPNDDRMNQHRHCEWACELIRRLEPDEAWDLLECHERFPAHDDGDDDTERDRWNNRVGIAIGDTIPSDPPSCYDLCKDAVDDGVTE